MKRIRMTDEQLRAQGKDPEKYEGWRLIPETPEDHWDILWTKPGFWLALVLHALTVSRMLHWLVSG